MQIPEHIAIIMDGNGRWAKKRGLPRSAGHKKGIEALRNAVKASIEFKVKHLSVFVFSAENWNRPKKEVSFLMKLFKDLVFLEVEKLHKQGVKVKFCGNIKGLDEALQQKIAKCEEKTSQNNELTLNFLVNYGARQEIVAATREIHKDISSGKIKEENLDIDLFSSYLQTFHSPDPELVIRTSGEFRLSNFLLWQISYSEIFISDVLWPDFNKEEYKKALIWYNERERRFGGLTQ